MSTAHETIAADFRANRGDPRAIMTVLSYRAASLARGEGSRPRWWSVPIGILYRLFSEILLGVDLPWSTRIGPGLRVQHGFGLTVHPKAVLGARCTLKQGVTIGIRSLELGRSGAPTIDDDVEIGSGAQLLGPIRVGAGALIGAGAIVLKDVPAAATAVGNPARVVLR